MVENSHALFPVHVIVNGVFGDGIGGKLIDRHDCCPEHVNELVIVPVIFVGQLIIAPSHASCASQWIKQSAFDGQFIMLSSHLPLSSQNNVNRVYGSGIGNVIPLHEYCPIHVISPVPIFPHVIRAYSQEFRIPKMTVKVI